MTREKISPHFAAVEFDCHDGTPWPPAAREALALWAAVWGEPLRRAFGPVRVTSGFRTPTYNRSVGGAPESFHVYTLRYGPQRRRPLGVGVAGDVVPARGSVADWQVWADRHMRTMRSRPGGVLGVSLAGRLAAVGYRSQGFIHVDTGNARTWAG